MRKLSWIALLAIAVAGSARAQVASIDPGMSREQVIARLGKPISEHSSGDHTYLYYSNGDEKKYGMHDLVALENGKVVDAVFRASTRKFSGKSSSPAPVPVEAAIAKGHGRVPPKPAPVEKKPAPPVTKAQPPAPTKAPPPTPKKAEPPAAKKAEPPTKKEAPPVTKAQPPAPTKTAPPAKAPPAKAAPPAKSSDTAKKATPAPTKKP
jgi:hypothetical protein